MEIEKEIFKRSIFVPDKLLSYGFCQVNGDYYFSRSIMDEEFSMEVKVAKGVLSLKIFDLDFHEEYTNYRMDSLHGEFVNRVRKEIEDCLLDIRRECTVPCYFVSFQANQVAQLIYEEYHDVPEFPWDDLSGSGVFRNPKNGKWYGLVMNIPKKRIAQGEECVDVLNVKLNPDLIVELLTRPGFYPAYHMNKKNWITILLDGTISSSEIMGYIKESHQFTEKK